ncbi:MAG: DUF1570 domain-containing protein [Phycisphaerae bacterium]|nr:DUF1570 domain-containing protein [Phycisphaerae bacterium]
METEHFRLIHDMRADEAEGMAKVLEFAHDQFGSYFGGYGFELHDCGEPLEWMCFRKKTLFADYAFATENADLSWLSGYYSSRTNRVAVVRPWRVRKWYGPGRHVADVSARVDDGVDDGLVKIVHEAGHQLAFNMGLQKRGVMYPFWATEGIALVFEDCVSEYLPRGRYSDGRKERLLELYRAGSLIGVHEFITMSRLPAGVRDADVYAQAWGFFQFLCANRAEDLKEYFARLYSLRPGGRSVRHLRREFEQSFGPLDHLNREWLLFLKSSAAAPYVCQTCPSRDGEHIKTGAAFSDSP